MIGTVFQLAWKATDASLNVLASETFTLTILQPVATVTVDLIPDLTYEIVTQNGAVLSTPLTFSVSPVECEPYFTYTWSESPDLLFASVTGLPSVDISTTDLLDVGVHSISVGVTPIGTTCALDPASVLSQTVQITVATCISVKTFSATPDFTYTPYDPAIWFPTPTVTWDPAVCEVPYTLVLE